MIDVIKNIFFPKRCPGCRELMPAISKVAGDERVLCGVCRAKWEAEKNARCKRCGRHLYECRCSKDLLWKSGVRHQLKLVRYRPGDNDCVANSLIHSMKRNNNELVFAFVAEQLGRVLTKYIIENDMDMGNTIITYVPRNERQIKLHGYDHAKKLASLLADTVSLEAKPLLVRCKRSTEQKYLNRAQRIENVRGAFAVARDTNLRGKTVFVVDDVVTSGASMAECASCLRGKGAENIIAVSFASTK